MKNQYGLFQWSFKNIFICSQLFFCYKKSRLVSTQSERCFITGNMYVGLTIVESLAPINYNLNF